MSKESVSAQKASGVRGQFGELAKAANSEPSLSDEDDRCARCGVSIEDAPEWAGLCRECAEGKSACPDCLRDTSGLNPAENGCPDCGGGINDCEGCGATGCASLRDNGSYLCYDCHESIVGYASRPLLGHD